MKDAELQRQLEPMFRAMADNFRETTFRLNVRITAVLDQVEAMERDRKAKEKN